MKKRGTSQIDWIMSMALFLLYVAWFFFFISPSIDLGSNKDSMGLLLKSNFYDEFKTELRRFPLFIESENLTRRKPVFVNYTINWTDIKFESGDSFFIWGNKLVFLANLSPETETYWILEGGNYVSEYMYEGINIEPDWVSTENLSVEYKDSLPKKAVYKGNTRWEDADYYLNDVDFDAVATSYDDSGIAGIYTAGTENINHTSMVFAGNQEIYNFITPESPDSSFIFGIDMELEDYNHYYSDNNNYGTMEYTGEVQELGYTYDYITLYSGTEGLSMYFDEDVDFNLSFYNKTLFLKIRVPVSDEYRYRMVFHDGNYTSVSREEYSARFGVIDTIEGIYLENITTNYTYLKEKWNFLSSKEFSIRVYENTSAYSYLQESPLYEIGLTPGRRNVLALRQDLYALDTGGTLTPINVNYRIW
ncbi:hypothetical protein JXC34_07285 [Candidatus Woesearchaeota archaeon]|nr:hypothetical protein [Candidatus Woesearchaeota archaeon]